MGQARVTFGIRSIVRGAGTLHLTKLSSLKSAARWLASGLDRGLRIDKLRHFTQAPSLDPDGEHDAAPEVLVRFDDSVCADCFNSRLWTSGSRLDRTDITVACGRTGASAADFGHDRRHGVREPVGGSADGQSQQLEIDDSSTHSLGPSFPMPIPGRRVFQEIRDAHEQARAAVERAGGVERKLKSDIERLVSDRGAALLELAQHDLPDLRRETIQSIFDEIQKDLLLIVERKERSITEIHGRVQRLLAAEQQLAQSRSLADTQLTSQLTEQARLQAVVTTELQSHAEFPVLSKQAVDAEAALHRDEERVADVQSGAREKLPTYERSSLFQYLYCRRYLTPEYTQRGWTRRLDRWVSEMIGYPTAQRGYDFLKNTPVLMQNELARRRDVFHQLMTQVEQIENDVARQVGLTQAISNASTTREQRDRLDQQLASSRQLIVKAQADLTAMSQDQCQFYRDALDRYRAFLNETETAVLEQRAARTPSTRDDEIVSRIRFLAEQIGTLKLQLQTTAQAVVATVGISDGFEFITRRIEQSNFEEDRSHFNDQLELDQLLERFRTGALSRDALWSELKLHQAFERTPTETTVMDVVNHPMTHVLANAMVQVLGAALQHGVSRSIQRRSGPSGSGWSGSLFPETSAPTWVRTSPPPSASRPSGGEYTTVDRF